MRLRALFDFPPWQRGEVFEIEDTFGKLLLESQFGHFEVLNEVQPPAEPVAEPEPAPDPEPLVAAFAAPPADKMIRKAKAKK